MTTQPINPYEREGCWLCDGCGEVETHDAKDQGVTVGCPVCVQNDHEWIQQKVETERDQLKAYCETLLTHLRGITRPGVACLDGGKCNHGCVDRCWRQHNCGTLSLADPLLDGLPWELRPVHEAVAARADQIEAAKQELTDKAIAYREEARRLKPDPNSDGEDEEEGFRKGFWWGFERARMSPSEHDIRSQYEDVKALRKRNEISATEGADG